MKTVLPLVAAVVLATPGLARCQEARTVIRHLSSRALGDERYVQVFLPEDYEIAKRRYPVIYLLDGDIRGLSALTVGASSFGMTLDARDHALPPHIVVAVMQKERGREFGRGRAAFAAYLQTELVPAVEREFRASGFRIIIGHSLGGHFALETLCGDTRFAATIAVSPAVAPAELAPLTACLRHRFAADSGRLTEIVISSGTRAADRTEDEFRPQHERLAGFLSDSAPPSVRWSYLKFADVSHSQTPFFTIPQGLWFIHDRAVWDLAPSTYDSVFAGKLDIDSTTSRFTRALVARVGFAVAPEAKWMHMSVLMKSGVQRLAAALAYVRAYPEDVDAHLALADALAAQGDSVAARKARAEALALTRRRPIAHE